MLSLASSTVLVPPLLQCYLALSMACCICAETGLGSFCKAVGSALEKLLGPDWQTSHREVRAEFDRLRAMKTVAGHVERRRTGFLEG